MPILKPTTFSPLLTRSLHASPSSAGVVNAILHGSKEAKQEGESEIRQHSKLVGRGEEALAGPPPYSVVQSSSADLLPSLDHRPQKYVHEFQKHTVLPHHVPLYKSLIAQYYQGIADSPEFDTRLFGSWEIVVGEVDTFVHIWEYEGLPGFESVKNKVKNSQGHLEFFNHDILPLVQRRTSQLCQEFAFWQSAAPAVNGGIYELRSYDLQPGKLLEWEHEWRVGLEARLQSGHSPVGAWFSQLGKLHQVHHMWQYESLEHRRETREKAWGIDTWSGTVAKLTSPGDPGSARGLCLSDCGCGMEACLEAVLFEGGMINLVTTLLHEQGGGWGTDGVPTLHVWSATLRTFLTAYAATILENTLGRLVSDPTLICITIATSGTRPHLKYHMWFAKSHAWPEKDVHGVAVHADLSTVFLCYITLVHRDMNAEGHGVYTYHLTPVDGSPNVAKLVWDSGAAFVEQAGAYWPQGNVSQHQQYSLARKSAARKGHAALGRSTAF
ncbi:NIPSNAP family protein [Pseudohyphozyma bogoriensis]|nr:NIPSNAP family protein [Pseudohyphozyma bogoriensis]